MGTIHLGPLAISVGVLLLLLAVVVAVVLARLLGRERGAILETQLWKILAVGVVGARLAFVGMYWDKYESAPIGILDIRDGGLLAGAGIAATLAMAAWAVWRERVARKALLLSVLAGCLVWIAGAAASLVFDRGTKELPDVTLSRLDGRPVQLKSLAGKPLVLNLWATWCPPCRREMPAMREAQLRHPDIVFVFANQGETAATVRRYLDEAGLVLDNVLLDPQRESARQLGSQALPTTLFFDEHGGLAGRRVGQMSTATLEQRIVELRGLR